MEPLIHFAIPFAILTMLGIRPKVAIPVSLLALVPDMDVFFGIHKWFLHSIIILIPLGIGLSIVFLLRRTGLRNYAPLGLLAMLSHPVLDVFWNYTPILWPVYGESIWINLGINLQAGSSLGIGHNVGVLTQPTSFEAFTTLDAPLVTGAGLIIFVLLVILPVLLMEIRGRRSWL
ncbi:hypothetical protein AKJ44_01495 [candidate division MSBL1 archaeon SCGC-AAA261F17]|uniref:Metal-dependent hydrolase n=2 Tax=candidate division MSBL1 TaxID=215777 RepID=A0A133V6H4_9EURY|nr:hypothetical protein AKJ44_01495 [candidate division MSBL1 archaeon SCGC-AAA261F17]KXB03941.1 hypothetical protein AKJ47_01390 [candidate division MSBL1 archaeon SCGC-AAA261G05]